MTSPFDIEEIFPDDAGPVRLPRRQSGSAPQGMAVTLLADYTLRTHAWLPSAAIVALLAESGVTPAGARTAISRLARRGVLEGSRHGRNSFYRLSRAAAVNLAAGGSRIMSMAAGTQAWDGRWTLIAFSLPQQEASQRHALRNHLRWLGCAPLYDGLWLHPHELTGRTCSELAGDGLGALTVFRARHQEVATVGRQPIDAWDTPAIATQYERFIEHWSDLVPKVRTGQITGTEAVRVRTEIMDTYRRFPILDPQLPLDLLPPGWPRQAARDVFVAVYDGLAEAAQHHVRTVTARYTDGPAPGIQAHSVADLIARTHLPGGAPDDAVVHEPA